MWTPTLRGIHRLSVLENSMLRKIFWTRRDEVRGMWRRLHNELYTLYSSPNIQVMKKNKIGEHIGGETLGRPGRQWKHNTKIYLEDVD
jgi:uncharacterized protein involved in tellurium resistance